MLFLTQGVPADRFRYTINCPGSECPGDSGAPGGRRAVERPTPGAPRAARQFSPDIEDREGYAEPRLGVVGRRGLLGPTSEGRPEVCPSGRSGEAPTRPPANRPS